MAVLRPLRGHVERTELIGVLALGVLEALAVQRQELVLRTVVVLQRVLQFVYLVLHGQESLLDVRVVVAVRLRLLHQLLRLLVVVQFGRLRFAWLAAVIFPGTLVIVLIVLIVLRKEFRSSRKLVMHRTCSKCIVST